MTEEQFAAVRLDTSEEVVEKLALEPAWLNNGIPQNRVPHLCSGVARGVTSTADHVLEIDRLLPEPLGCVGRDLLAVVDAPRSPGEWKGHDPEVAAAPRGPLGVSGRLRSRMVVPRPVAVDQMA